MLEDTMDLVTDGGTNQTFISMGLTIDGMPMASPSRQTCCSRSRLLRDLQTKDLYQ